MNLKNLQYRLRRIFYGESGIVKEVEPERNGYFKSFIKKDDDGNLPARVFFTNPLGEELSLLSPMIIDSKSLHNSRIPIEYLHYKKYKPGDKFP
jgi:hypothetical protein